MTVEEFRRALLTTGASLNPATTLGELNRFETQKGVRLSQAFRQLYLEFDGFAANHFNSQICLWPLSRISENADLETHVDGQLYFPIGDLLVDSDFLMASLEDGGRPIFLFHERRILATSLQEFLEQFLSGTFDFQ